MTMNDHPKFVIVGGGLGGALAACYLGQAGYEVDVYEVRGDLRTGAVGGGRSINLALSYRGIAGLEGVGLADEVLSQAVCMRGRMIHSVSGALVFQPYGRDDSQTINSVSRSGLNRTLLTAAGKHEDVRLHFHQKCTDVDLDTNEVFLTHTETAATSTVTGDIIVSADGAFSAVRRAMQRRNRFNYRQDYLQHGYKELTIPPAPDGGFRLEKNALHIWPRRSLMMIALPNLDASYTVTLFWPFEGPGSFEAIKTESDLLAFFDQHFPDAVEHMPTLVEDYFSNPVGSLMTVRCNPWYVEDRAVILGDAAHAVVPFYGQGMNASFEDVLVLDDCMKKYAPNWRRAFESYDAIRRKHVDALADLALANFVEMRDHTGSKLFLLRKKKERLLNRLFPRWYLPLYTMATFTRIPYADAVARAKRQDRIVFASALVILLVIAALIVVGW